MDFQMLSRNVYSKVSFCTEPKRAVRALLVSSVSMDSFQMIKNVRPIKEFFKTQATTRFSWLWISLDQKFQLIIRQVAKVGNAWRKEKWKSMRVGITIARV